MSYFLITKEESAPLELSANALGKGGEGTVVLVVSHGASTLPPAEDLVAKLYHNPEEDDRKNKLKAMLSFPVEATAVAWPLAIVVDESKRFRGYLMKKLDKKNYREWMYLAHAKERRKTTTSFDVRYALSAIRNLAVAMQAIHDAGHCIGDLNESNISIATNSTIFIVDTDSAQITTPEGKIFPCVVGKPEFTAPELSHGPLREQRRTEASDVFAFAVASYQMLTGGAHPTDAVYEGEDDPPGVVEKMRRGIYPGLKGSSQGFKHPPRISMEGIPRSFQTLLLRALEPNPQMRPSLNEVLANIDAVLPALVQCSKVKHHWYDSRDGSCGWCAHVARGQVDPWADKAASAQAPSAKQYALPALGFQEDDSAPVVRRAPAAPAGPPPVQAPQNYPPTSQNSSPPTATYGTPPAPPVTPQGPAKAKNGKTILTYADGSQGIRPPIAVLIRSNPRLARQCIANETPAMAQFWWPASRDLANPNALVAGLLLASVIGTLWSIYLPQLFMPFGESWAAPLVQLASVIAGVGACMSALWLTFSGLWDRRRARKSAGGLDGFATESFPKTISRYGVLSVIYGPFLALALFASAIYLAFTLLLSIIKEGGKPASRY